jgi:hypothetical protein
MTAWAAPARSSTAPYHVKLPATASSRSRSPRPERLEPLGAQFSLLVDGKHGDGALGTMPCTCRGHDKPHVHYFVESDLLRSLAAGSEVDLFLDEDARRLLVVTA